MEPIDPPVEPDTDLRDFEFMPLSVQRVCDSDLVAECSGDEIAAALLLWCKAWHQVPASSLPDNDHVLAMLAGCGRGAHALERWSTIKAGAMRGFEKASDGLLYHPVIAEKAREAWVRKQAAAVSREQNAEKLRRWREQKRQQNQGDDTVTQHDEIPEPVRNRLQNRSGNSNVTSMTGIGKGRGTGTNNTILPQPEAEDEIGDEKTKREPKPLSYPADFEAFWLVYPRKVGKAEALRAYLKSKKLIGQGADAKIVAGATAYRTAMRGKEEQYIAHPATWLNQGRWDDEAMPSSDGSGVLSGRNSFGVGG